MKKKVGLKAGATLLACSMVIGNMPLGVLAKDAKQEDGLKIGIMSDTHYFSKKLYSECEDFTTAMNSDRKMFKEGDAILTAALNDLVRDEPDVVLVSGDLTKDGEQVNHEIFADKLQDAKERLAKKGVDTKFYVVNGNHDINNPNGKDFSSGKAVDADRTTVEEFKEIYEDFGYGEDSVQYREDSDRGGSLSYVVQPEEGYTLIVIDSGKYSSDQTASGQDLQETGGVIGKDLLNWITEEAQKAKERGDVVLAMQHHGVIPHFDMEPEVMSDYLVDNWQEVEMAYADAGISYVFTGHMHANDIASYTSPSGNTLYDIETGSLLTYPSYMREAVVKKGNAKEDTSSTIELQSVKPETVMYEDFDTGEIKEIKDITEYAKAHTLSNDVVKTMLTEGLLSPFFENALEQGGSKVLVSGLLGVDPSALNSYLTEMLVGLLPTTKEEGFQITVSGFTVSIYYDGASEQIKISQVTEKAADALDLTNLLDSESIELLTSQPMAAADNKIEFFVQKASIGTFFDGLFKNIDKELLEQPDHIFEVVNTLVDEILNAKVDETHTVFELVNTIYQSHLLGSENCEAWVETAIGKIKNEKLLDHILTEAIRKTQPALNEALSVIPVDLKSILEKGNTNFMTNLVYGVVCGMFKNVGDVMEQVDLSTVLPEELLHTVGEFAYNVAYTMSHDSNYSEDNNTAIVIARMLSEIILDANTLLEEVEKIPQGNYTEESYQNLQAAIKGLKDAIAKKDKEAVKSGIYAVEKAKEELKEVESNSSTQKPNEQNDNNKDNGQQNQKQPNKQSSTVHTGDDMNLTVVMLGTVIAVTLSVIYMVLRKRKFIIK